MKRTPLLLALTIVFSLATGLSASALPAPSAGGPAALLRYVGDPSSATGNAVSNGECDVNGDDFDDAVVGAWFWDKAPTANIGAAYVLFGGEGAHGAALSDPTDANAVRIDGPTDDPRSVGFSVGCLGDVNGDGFDDIGIGDYIQNRAVVIFGAANFGPLSLDSIGDRGFVVREPFTAAADRTNLSFSMSAVGDIDNDGKDDFALAAVVADTLGRNNNGKVWVLKGRADIDDVNLADPGTSVLLSVDGAIAEERLGSVARAGDVNGDGIDDFVLGSYTSTPWGSTVAVPGAAYVVFGGNSGSVDLANLGTKGFSIYGPKRQRDRLGISVSALGDINADGKADLLIGGDGVNNATTGPRTGSAAVVLGSAATDTVYTDPVPATGQTETVYTCATPEVLATPCADRTHRGYWINGEVNSDSFGYSVAGIGDVNGDNVPDLAVGAYGFDPVNPDAAPATMSGAGATYVLFGRTTGTLQNTVGLTDADGYRIDGLKAGDRFGRQVGAIGDFDGNGVRDLVASGDFASRTATTGAVGEAQTLTATVTKPAGSTAPVATGTVAFTRNGGDTVPGCGAVAVTAGQAVCTFTPADEISTSYVATYSGTPTIAESESTPLNLAITKEPTMTSLTSSSMDVRTGQLTQLIAGVVDDSADPVSTGTVRFESNGDPIAGCKSVPVSDGDAVCTTSWSTKGEVQVKAIYSGTNLLAESTSGEITIAVGTDSVIKPDEVKPFTYGTKPDAITGEVRAGASTPTGTVELKRDGNVVKSVQLDGNGEFSFELGALDLPPGAHTLTLVYSGDDTNRAAERDIAVTVAKATGIVKFWPSATKMKVGQRLTVAIRVGAKGVTPTGIVQIKFGDQVMKNLRVAPGTITHTFSAFGLKGVRNVSVAYVGSDTVTPATSPVIKVTVQ